MEPIILAGRIKALREAKGFTINKLASQAGISQSFLRDIELGNKKPTVDTLDAICWALDISLSDFFSVVSVHLNDTSKSFFNTFS